MGAPGASIALSEAWAVASKHEGFYTGGKVVWSDGARSFACLCSEELHLVDLRGNGLTRRVGVEGDEVMTFDVDGQGHNACTSHRSGLLRHFKLGAAPSVVRAWKPPNSVVSDVCFDATGGLVATGSVDRTVRVWDFAGYFCTHNFRGHSALVSIVRFHPTRLQVVSVAEAEIRLWDLSTSACVGIMKDHFATISSICFAQAKGRNAQLLSAGRDQVINVWNLEGNCGKKRSFPVFEKVEGIVAIPLSTLRESTSCENGRRKNSLRQWARKDTASTPYVFITVGEKCVVRVWNPIDGSCLLTKASPHAAGGLFRSVLFIDEPQSARIVTVGEDMNFVSWPLPDFEPVTYFMGYNDELVHVQMIPRLDPDSDPPERFVCVANDEHPRVVSCSGFQATLLRGHTDIVICCDVSVDGRWIATGGKDQSIRVWDAKTLRCVCTVAGHSGPVSALAFPRKRPRKTPTSTDRRKLVLVSGSQDTTMKVWELPDAASLQNLAEESPVAVDKSSAAVVAHAKEVNDVCIAPNNKLIASGGQDKLVRIWTFPKAELLGECKGHRRGVWCVAFSPRDQVVASASGDSTVRLWNLADFTPIRAFQGHSGAVLRVCFLDSGMQLMTSGADGLLKLWNIRTADCVVSMEEHEGRVWCIDVMGDRMISCGTDSKLCIWKDVTSEKAKERHHERADAAMKESKIGILVKEGKIEKALSLCLELNRPGHMRQIVMEHALEAVGRHIVRDADAEAAEDERSHQPSADVDLRRWVGSLTTAELEKLVDLIEQWNTNRRMAPFAQMLLGLIFLEVPAATLLEFEGMNATCEALLSYSARHYARVDSLLQKTFLFDLVLQASGGLLAEPPADGFSEDAAANEPHVATGESLRRTLDVLLGSRATGFAEDLSADEGPAAAEGRCHRDASDLSSEGVEEEKIGVSPKRRRFCAIFSRA